MVAAGKRSYTCAEAKEYYAPFQREASSTGVVKVLHLDDIPIVTDPASVLSTSELHLHHERENQTMYASFKCMPDEVRFGVFKGYVYHPSVIGQYNREQVAWFKEMRHLLGEKEHHDPELEEQLKEFFGCGTSTFFRLRFALLHPGLMIQIHSRIRLGGADYLYVLYGVPDPDRNKKIAVAA